MQHFCNHGYIFERRFSPIFVVKPFHFHDRVVKDNVNDHISFDLKSLA